MDSTEKSPAIGRPKKYFTLEVRRAAKTCQKRAQRARKRLASEPSKIAATTPNIDRRTTKQYVSRVQRAQSFKSTVLWSLVACGFRTHTGMEAEKARLHRSLKVAETVSDSKSQVDRLKMELKTLLDRVASQAEVIEIIEKEWLDTLKQNDELQRRIDILEHKASP